MCALKVIFSLSMQLLPSNLCYVIPCIAMPCLTISCLATSYHAPISELAAEGIVKWRTVKGTKEGGVDVRFGETPWNDLVQVQCAQSNIPVKSQSNIRTSQSNS